MLTQYSKHPEAFDAGIDYITAFTAARVLEHEGHSLTCATYNKAESITIECLDCSEVVWDNGK